MNWLNEVGTFRARAVGEPEWKESKEKGTPYIEVMCETSAGRIRWKGWLTPGGLPQTVKGLRAMGWQGTNLEDLSTVGSKEFEIVTKSEPYNGKDYCKVQWVNDLDGAPVQSSQGGMDEAKRKKLARDLQGSIRALGPAPAPKPAARPAPAPAPSAFTGTDDDMPF